MADHLELARSRLYEAVRDGASAAAPWRVHEFTPAQIAAPCVYLDSVELGFESLEGATFTVATFPVVLVADGMVRAQMFTLERVLARVWDAALAAGGEPEPTRPVALDVGGPNLRAHTVRVGMIITARTLCVSLVSADADGGGL